MYWPLSQSITEDQTAWPIFVIRIVFDHLASPHRFAYLLNRNLTQ